MKTKWIEEEFKYDGTQLRSLFAYMSYGIQGDSIVAWRGPCDIPPEHMVDGEDLRQNDTICGSNMVHFIVELFESDLRQGVLLQRLFSSIVKDLIESESEGVSFSRKGDDLYWQEKKLNISIATASPVSTLIHFAVNISNEGTPVPTCALEDFGLDSNKFAQKVLEKVALEWVSIKDACCKVHWVK